MRHEEADLVEIVGIGTERELYAMFKTEGKEFRIRSVSRMKIDFRRHVISAQQFHHRSIELFRLHHSTPFGENPKRMRQNPNAGLQQSFRFFQEFPFQSRRILLPEEVVNRSQTNLCEGGILRQKSRSALGVGIDFKTV